MKYKFLKDINKSAIIAIKKKDGLIAIRFNNQKNHYFTSSLTAFMNALNDKDFVLINRSFYVNRDFIEEIKDNQVLIQGSYYEISRRCLKNMF